MKKLDFIIIGAQKSATTSLYHYLKPHSKIHMSSSKEAPFFSKDELYNDGWEKFADEYFDGAKDSQLWGTASPQYMGNPNAPERIYQSMPKAKLIAVLRNPIDRAYSHFTMSVRRGQEMRTFDEAVADLLKVEALDNARLFMPVVEAGMQEEDETGHYVVWSEYGRILNKFLKYFPKQQLMVLFMDDIIETPDVVYKKIIQFIGLENNEQIPSNLGKVYHKGGTQRIIPDNWRETLKSNSVFRYLWDKVPEKKRADIRYAYDQKNLKKDSGKKGPSASTREILAKHFAKDITQLESIIGQTTPWNEFETIENSQVEKNTESFFTTSKVFDKAGVRQ